MPGPLHPPPSAPLCPYAPPLGPFRLPSRPLWPPSRHLPSRPLRLLHPNLPAPTHTQVVEAVLDALEGKLSPNAVNAPMVPAEVRLLLPLGAGAPPVSVEVKSQYVMQQSACRCRICLHALSWPQSPPTRISTHLGTQVLKELQPFISLAEGLGRAAVSLVAETWVGQYIPSLGGCCVCTCCYISAAPSLPCSPPPPPLCPQPACTVWGYGLH